MEYRGVSARATALQHLQMYFERTDMHMEQLDKKPTCNKVLNCVVQTSAKGISSMRIHTMAARPWSCCVIERIVQTGAKRWLRTGHLGWMFCGWMFLYYLNLPARRRLESLSVSDLAFIASGIFPEGSVIHISERVWWQCLKIWLMILLGQMEKLL